METTRMYVSMYPINPLFFTEKKYTLGLSKFSSRKSSSHSATLNVKMSSPSHSIFLIFLSLNVFDQIVELLMLLFLT